MMHRYVQNCQSVQSPRPVTTVMLSSSVWKFCLSLFIWQKVLTPTAHLLHQDWRTCWDRPGQTWTDLDQVCGRERMLPTLGSGRPVSGRWGHRAGRPTAIIPPFFSVSATTRSFQFWVSNIGPEAQQEDSFKRHQVGYCWVFNCLDKMINSICSGVFSWKFCF